MFPMPITPEADGFDRPAVLVTAGNLHAESHNVAVTGHVIQGSSTVPDPLEQFLAIQQGFNLRGRNSDRPSGDCNF